MGCRNGATAEAAAGRLLLPMTAVSAVGGAAMSAAISRWGQRCSHGCCGSSSDENLLGLVVVVKGW